MKQVADELGVRYVVEGSVRKDGDRVRVTAQLNDVSTGSHIWAERYDRGLADVFAMQDEITEAIVAAIEPQLYAAENFRAQRKAPGQHGRLGSGDARAVALLARDAAGQRRRAGAAGKGHRHRSRTTARRSACSPPATSSARIWAGRTTAATVPIAERAALAAIRADSEDPWAHHALGTRLSARAPLRRFAGRVRAGAAAQSELLRWRRAITACRCAIAGAGRRATTAARRALRLSPRDPYSAVYYGIKRAYAQFLGRNYDEAIRLSRKSLRQRSDFVGAASRADRTRRNGRSKVMFQRLRYWSSAAPSRISRWPGSRTHMPIRHDADREHYLDGFRRAGLD